VRAAQGFNDTDAFATQDPIVAGLIASDDAHEAAQAFADKRAPVWHGR
jgi:enoyl-CoA hydratase